MVEEEEETLKEDELRRETRCPRGKAKTKETLGNKAGVKLMGGEHEEEERNLEGTVFFGGVMGAFFPPTAKNFESDILNFFPPDFHHACP